MLPFEDALPFETLPFEEDSPAQQELGEMKSYGKKVLNSALGVAETGASMLAGIPAQIGGGLYGLGTLLSGQGIENAGNAVTDFQKSNFGFGEYVPSTDVGKKGAELLQNVMAAPGEGAGYIGGKIGKALGNEALGELSAKLPVDAAMNFLPFGAVAKATAGSTVKTAKRFGYKEPVTESMGSKLDALDASKAPEVFGKTDEVLPFEQQELLPTRAPQYGVSDTITGDHWAVDENGIPIRADLSIEAQQLQDPLQRNLWGDELSRKSEQEGLPLTEAIDKMPDLPWRSDRDVGLEMLRDEIPVSEDLLGATRMANSQQGALNYKDVSEAISKAMKSFNESTNNLSKVEISKLAPKDNQDYAAQIPGMAKLVDGIIPRPESFEAAKGKLLSAENVSVKKNIMSGPEMAGEKYRNYPLAWASKQLQWADKKFDYASRQLVRPVERAIANLDNKSMIDLTDVLKREMFDRKQYTPEQLQSVMTKKQYDAYTALRKEFDTVYEMQNAALIRQGKEPITKQQAYLASIRQGDYHIPVKDAKGNTVWHIQARSKGEANKAVKWLKDNVPGIQLPKVEYRASNLASGIPKDVLGGFQELMKLLDEGGDASFAIKEAIRAAQEKAGYDSFGQSNRFLEKANIRGFEGDMPWLSAKENSHRLMNSQVDYLNSAYKWSYLQDALGEVKHLMADPDFINKQPDTAAYIKDVVRQQVGLGDHLTKAAEEFVMNSIGGSRAQLRQGAGKLGSWTSLLQLGMSTGYMIATPLTAMYAVGQHLRSGTLSRNMIVNSMYDTSAGLINLWMHEGGKQGKLPMTELGRDALKYAEDNGIVTKNMFGDLEEIGQNKMVENALSIPKATISIPEKIQRLSTFMSFVHGLKEKGGFTNMYDLFQRAETLTNIAATNFRSSEQPLGIQKFGVLGSAAFKYKAPILNYYHQLHMLGRDAKQNPRNSAPLLGFLGMTAMLGGLQNLPGINELDGAWNLVKGAVAKVAPDQYSKVKDVDVKEFIRKNAGEAAAYGAVQEAMGAQMSQRFGSDLANLEDPVKNMFPVTGTIGNIAGAGGSLLGGNVSQAAWNLSPPIARGNLETRDDAFRGLQPGSFRKPSDISNTDIQQIRTPEDETYRKFGLRSSEESKRLESSAKANKEQQRINVALEGNMNKLVNNAIAGNKDKVENFGKAWLQLNPDSSAFQSALTDKLNKASLSPEQRQLIGARTLMQIQQVMRIRDARQ